jgi:hypothetical protein
VFDDGVGDGDDELVPLVVSLSFVLSLPSPVPVLDG